MMEISAITPPPCLFLSNQYGLEKPSIKNWDIRKVSLNLVSVKLFKLSIQRSVVDEREQQDIGGDKVNSSISSLAIQVKNAKG